MAAVTILFMLPLGGPAFGQFRVLGEPVPLTSSAISSTNPRWSPDGETIAFTGSGYTGLRLLDVRTGAIRTVTEEQGVGFGFSWSPDGRKIVARVSRVEDARRYSAIKVFDVESGEVQQLTEYRGAIPALPRWNAGGELVILYAGERLEVFDMAEPPASTRRPERRELAIGEQGIVEADLSSEEVRTVSAVRDVHVLNLVQSPDGSRVAFEVLGGHLYSMNAAGTDLVDLGPGNRPSWSPDGRWIAFVRADDDGHQVTSSDLFAVRADGSERIRLTDTPNRLETNPTWSPDGTRIAYDDLSDGIIYALTISP